MHVTIIYALVAHTLIVPYLEVQGLTLGAQGYQFKVNITFYLYRFNGLLSISNEMEK